MAIRYDLEPLEAMDIFYGGKTNGVSREELVGFGKENGHELPPLLFEYLEKFAWLDVNKGECRLFHPELIFVKEAAVANEDTEIMVIGTTGADYLLGIDLGTEELGIVYGMTSEKGVRWVKGFNETLSGKLRLMFLTVFKNMDRYLFEGRAIDAVLKTHGADRSRIVPSEGSAQHFSISFDEDKREFIIAEFDLDKGEDIVLLQIFPLRTDRQNADAPDGTLFT